MDYEKGFDSIKHQAVFETLKKHGKQEKYFNITEKEQQR